MKILTIRLSPALGLTLLLAVAAAADRPADQPVFSHAGFAQLSRGELGNAGQNLFVSRRGALQLVNWFDFDRDGRSEIVVNNQHNPYENSDSLIYWQHPADGFRSLLPPNAEDAGLFQRIAALRSAEGHVGFLPTLGGGRSLVADLNRDGFPDIVVVNFFHGSTHDPFPVYVYWGGADGFASERKSEFPSRTAAGIAVADLDGNGFSDLIIANMGPEDSIMAAVRAPRREADSVPTGTVPSRIYWQGPLGFSLDQFTDVPTHYAVDVKVADMDGDGHLDLVFLQSGDVRTLRFFYGGEKGFSAEDSEEIAVSGTGYLDEKAGEIVVADVNVDGRPDVIVAAGGKEAQIFWNRFWTGRGNLQQWPRHALPANNPLSAAVGDFNGDTYPDVVLAGYLAAEGARQHSTEAMIYWGEPRRTLMTRPPATLPVLGSTAVRTADLNGDGHSDLVFANSTDNDTYDVPSYVYWGSAGGFSPAARAELTGFGAVGLAIADLNRDGRPDIFLANRDSGQNRSSSALNSYVYWGNARRSFSSAVQSKIPLHDTYSSVAADFYDEGRASLAWVDAKGVTLTRFNDRREVAGLAKFPLPFPGTTSVVADLNRDGRLDLVVAGLAGEGAVAVLLGNGNGFDAPRLYQPGMQLLTVAVADLGGTGRLELILGGRGGWMRCPIAADGTLELARAQRVSGDFQVQRISVADLNDDGHPEVVAARYRQMSTRRNAIESAVYWNRGGRFTAEDITPLPTFGGHWASVADTTGTGRLDVLFSNYHGETTRVVPFFNYHPDAQGHYGAKQLTTLPAYSSSSHTFTDVDGDGFRDLVIMNHTGPTAYAGLRPKNGNHGVGSWVYWGGPEGFSVSRRATISSYGPHTALNAENGDLLRRRTFETYTSPWEMKALAVGDYDLTVSGVFTGRADCRVWVQTDQAKDEWTPLEVVTKTETAVTCRLSLPGQVAGLRYRLELETGGAGTGPTIESITLSRQ